MTASITECLNFNDVDTQAGNLAAVGSDGNVERKISSDQVTDIQQSDSATVVGSFIISFATGLSPQQKEDVMLSTLLAHIKTKDDYDYEHYTNILQGVGWDIKKSDQSFEMDVSQPNPASSKHETVDQIVITILSKHLDEKEVALFTTTVGAVKVPRNSQANKRARILLNGQASTPRNEPTAHFRAGLCRVTNSGNILCHAIGHFSYNRPNSAGPKESLLNDCIDPTAFDIKDLQQMELNEQKYALPTGREFVRKELEHLGANVTGMIEELEL